MTMRPEGRRAPSSIAPQRTREIGTREAPVAPVNITATTSGAAQTFLTSPASATTRLSELHVRNTTGTAATLTFHAIPASGSIGDTNELLPQRTIPANSTQRIDGLVGGAWEAGTVFKVYSDTNGALLIWGTARITQ